MSKIFIAADHAGFEMKDSIIESMKDLSFEDLGTNSNDSVDYPDYAFTLSKKVLDNKGSFGILICGTGIGMCMAANKVSGIRCANLTSEKIASLAKEHNDANVISLSGRFVSLEENMQIINNFLNAKFEERHINRIKKINEK